MPHLEGTVVTILGLFCVEEDGTRVYHFRYDEKDGGTAGHIEETCMKPYK